MNIKDVKTAIKIGDFVLRQNHRNKIDIKHLSNIENKILRTLMIPLEAPKLNLKLLVVATESSKEGLLDNLAKKILVNLNIF